MQSPETAGSGISDVPGSGYTEAGYEAALKANLTNGKNAFRRSNVWQMPNHDASITGLMPRLYQHAFNVGAGITGPDCYLNHGDAAKDEIRAGNWSGKIPLALDHQRPGELFGGYTPGQVFLRVTEYWPLNHVMWNSGQALAPGA